jgi:hypothetical protein
MKFNCKTKEAKNQEKERHIQQWHDWFAWRPVRIGPEDCRWLEVVWRRGVYTVYAESNCDGYFMHVRHLDWEYSEWSPQTMSLEATRMLERSERQVLQKRREREESKKG